MLKKYIILLLILLLVTGCKPKTYTVSFINEDGTLLSSVDIQKGDNIKDIEEPVKEGYIFVSWEKDGLEYDVNTPVTDDITLTATWTEIPELATLYTISFNIDGTIKTQTVRAGETVEKPTDPYIANYKFLGWYCEEVEYDFETPVEKDFELTAKFEKEILTIKFDLDGGSGTSQMNIVKGNILTKPKDPTKFGYKFIKWTLNGEVYDFNTKVEDDITLTAVWEAIEYVKVKFDTDGGTSITPQTIEKGTKLSNVKTPIKEGYTFKYWTLKDEIFDINSPIQDSYTLKAVYEPIVEDSTEEE